MKRGGRRMYIFMALGLGVLGVLFGWLLGRFVTGDKKWAWIGGGICGTIGLLVLPIFVNYAATCYTSSLLFQSMGQGEIWWERFTIYWQLFGIGFAASMVFLLINVFVAAAVIPEVVSWGYRLLAATVIFLVALGFGIAAGANWDEILLYLNQVPFFKSDPLFLRDVGWYVFSYPLEVRLIAWGVVLTLVGVVSSAVVYWGQAKELDYYDKEGRERVMKTAIRHSSILLCLCVLLMGIYWALRRLALPIDPYSVWGYAGEHINGAGWVDQHFVSGALSILPWLSVIIAGGLLAAAFLKSWKILIGAIVVKLGYIVLILWIGTFVVWLFGVKPRELAKETTSIQWSNKATLEAFGLGELTVEQYPAKPLTTEAIAAAPKGVFENLRLLDPFQVFIRNADQDEEQRSYYDFQDPDVDFYRYPDGRLVQVMVGARELPEKEIPNHTWVNDHLVFTNGRGATMAQVNAFDTEGNMVYLVKGIPGKGPFVAKEEAIYYGETTSQWVATGTAEKEVGPPTPGGGWEEVEYEGSGGIPLGGLRRLAFAIRFDDLTLLLSDRIGKDTRIHFLRNIKERVSAIAPFLWLEEDPYIVVGKDYLWWIIDGSTYAGNYPYADSQQILPPSEKVLGKSIRYLRPSVKVVVNAYTGEVWFYEMDPEDPVLQAWKNTFPSLFQPLSAMPDELKAHLRYPEQVFIVQAKVLRRHHMTNPTALYNGEDLWEIAKEMAEGKIQETAPRYVLTVLPDEKEVEYILDWSYTRINKENGVAFLVARNRLDHYGQMILYTYPIGQMIMGPSQVENLIDQDPVLGPQLTLISQQGKEVVRGNLMVLPLKENVIYVKPIFVRSTAKGGGEGLPQLRFVVVGSTERRIAYGRTLDEALRAFVHEVSPVVPTKEVPKEEGDVCQELWAKLKKAYEERNGEEAARVSVELLVRRCK